MFGTKEIIILLIIIIGYYIITSFNNKQENFYDLPDTTNNQYWDPDWVGKTASDCYELNKRDCMKYSNCGLCLKDGKQECIPGDVQGPLFKEDCEGWQHTNYYDRHIFGEKVVTLSPPWSKFYPDYEARYPSPTSRATLQ